ncbi:hypothetical protein P3L10_005024 [Capsicum annuum]
MPHLHNLIDQPVIVVMQLRRAHKFQGVYSVQNTCNFFKLWINPDLSQANDFKFRLESVSEATSETLSQANSQHSLSISEELTAGTAQLKTVKELLDSAQVGHLWIVAKVVNLKLKNNWSYLGCTKCQKSIDEVAKILLQEMSSELLNNYS